MAEFQKYLEGVSRRLGDVEFVGGELIPNKKAAAAALLPKLAGADALLIIHLSYGFGDPMLKLTEAGLPTAIFSQPFSGHDWMFVVQAQKAGNKAILLPPRAWSELDRATALLRVPARMKQTRILYVGGSHGTLPARSAEQVKQRIGAELISISVPQVVAAHQAIELEVARAEAEEHWLKPARKIVEPSREEIVKSARMYRAMQRLMIEHGARAIIIEGHYRTFNRGGVPLGKHRVEIQARRATGKKVELPEGTMIEETVPIGAKEYGGPLSPLTVEVTAEGESRFDFEILL